jgi:hypothetical protein
MSQDVALRARADDLQRGYELRLDEKLGIQKPAEIH